MSSPRRIHKQPAFVLNRRPFSESSLIVDLFTRDYGRVGVLAKGARRLKSPYRGVLQVFNPLAVGWSGRRELVTLTRAEPVTRPFNLIGQRLVCGWYSNELLTRSLLRGDPHEQLFDSYSELIDVLSTGAHAEWSLRMFETALLKDVGYGILFDRDVVTKSHIDANRNYLYLAGRGPVEEGVEGFSGLPVGGRALIALATGELPPLDIQQEAKRLTRMLLVDLMEGRTLKSRSVFRQMYRTGGEPDPDEIADVGIA
ncbi:MAG: DNA repair protein RecO [marine bacterium B5-7]|nr:MAG: DNA repair protein RecO [marine bacterium B5-7]